MVMLGRVHARSSSYLRTYIESHGRPLAHGMNEWGPVVFLTSEQCGGGCAMSINDGVR